MNNYIDEIDDIGVIPYDDSDIEEELSFLIKQEKDSDEIMEFAIDRAFN